MQAPDEWRGTTVMPGDIGESARRLGYVVNTGPELEFFLFEDESPALKTLDRGGYFDLTTLDAKGDVRKQAVLALEAMGIEVEYSHHEVAPSQHEIDIRYNHARKVERIRVFEVGRVFLRDKSAVDGPLSVGGLRQPIRVADDIAELR